MNGALREAAKGSPRNVKLARVHRFLALLYGLLPIPFLVVMAQDKVHLTALAIVGAIFWSLTGIHFLVSLGANDGKAWARVSSLVIGAVMLLGFPIGTVIGGFFLISAGWSWESDDITAQVQQTRIPQDATRRPLEEEYKGPLGACPNCSATIPLTSLECAKCKAIFGPES